jgi:hypothetical protein
LPKASRGVRAIAPSTVDALLTVILFLALARPTNKVPAEIMLASMNKAMVLRFIDPFLLF